MTATGSTLIAKMQMRARRSDRIRVCGSDRVLTWCQILLVIPTA